MADETQELIDALQELEAELGSTPRKKDVRTHDELSVSVYDRVFGSWNNALREAGYKVNVEQNTTEDDLCDELQELPSELGSLPTISDIQEHSAYSHSVYCDRFGSIEDAYKAAGLVTI